MAEREPEKEYVPGCSCCTGNLTEAQLKKIRFLAITAITGVLAVAAAIAFQVLR